MSLVFDTAVQLRAYKIRGTATSPTLLITKDHSIYLHMEAAIHGERAWVFGPGELFGFNTGSMIQDDTETLKSFSDKIEVCDFSFFSRSRFSHLVK